MASMITRNRMKAPASIAVSLGLLVLCPRLHALRDTADAALAIESLGFNLSELKLKTSVTVGTDNSISPPAGAIVGMATPRLIIPNNVHLPDWLRQMLIAEVNSGAEGSWSGWLVVEEPRRPDPAENGAEASYEHVRHCRRHRRALDSSLAGAGLAARAGPMPAPSVPTSA
jgi:hypothetical protein